MAAGLHEHFRAVQSSEWMSARGEGEISFYAMLQLSHSQPAARVNRDLTHVLGIFCGLMLRYLSDIKKKSTETFEVMDFSTWSFGESEY